MKHSTTSLINLVFTDILTIRNPFFGSLERHPTNTATTTSPTSATITVTGLIHGVWYYQLAITNGGSTKYDRTVVRMDYDVPPAGATYTSGLSLTNQVLVDSTNSRYDTTQDIEGELTISEGDIFYNRGRLPDTMIDSLRGKFYITIEDGYTWKEDSYIRSERIIDSGWIIQKKIGNSELSQPPYIIQYSQLKNYFESAAVPHGNLVEAKVMFSWKKNC